MYFRYCYHTVSMISNTTSAMVMMMASIPLSTVAIVFILGPLEFRARSGTR